MAQFVSDVSKTAKNVPQDYVYPSNMRPKIDAPIYKEIPVIDLSLAMSSNVHDRTKVAEQLLKALDDGWGFQIINHGVSEKLMEDAMEVYKEFFNLPGEEKKKFLTASAENFRLWRESLYHACHSLEPHIDSWPEKPASYRKVIAEYASQTRKLTQKIFDLIAEGLGIEKQCFDGKFTENQTVRANYYPKSPDPSLTCGFHVHYDPNLITFLQQNISGLQILKDEEWVAVEPLPNAFFVNTGLELQIVSNGRFKATLHQVISNGKTDRLSIGIFMSSHPSQKIIKPDNAFVSDESPPKYKDYTFAKYSEVIQKISLESYHRNLSQAAIYASALDYFLSHPTLKLIH